MDGLVVALLHFAEMTLVVNFAAQGLIAIAYYAKAVLQEELMDKLVRTVVEHVEETVGCRMDAYADEVRKEVKKVTDGISEARDKMVEGARTMGAVCERLVEVEKTLS